MRPARSEPSVQTQQWPSCQCFLSFSPSLSLSLISSVSLSSQLSFTSHVSLSLNLFSCLSFSCHVSLSLLTDNDHDHLQKTCDGKKRKVRALTSPDTSTRTTTLQDCATREQIREIRRKSVVYISGHAASEESSNSSSSRIHSPSSFLIMGLQESVPTVVVSSISSILPTMPTLLPLGLELHPFPLQRSFFYRSSMISSCLLEDYLLSLVIHLYLYLYLHLELYLSVNLYLNLSTSSLISRLPSPFLSSELSFSSHGSLSLSHVRLQQPQCPTGVDGATLFAEKHFGVKGNCRRCGLPTR